MKKHFITFLLFTCVICIATVAPAEPSFSQRLNDKIQEAVANNLTNAYGTPLAIELARQGDIPALRDLVKENPSMELHRIHDKYGNNLLHVARNIKTIQAISSMIREADPADVTQHISALVNERNLYGETPLMTQIDNGHTDTFRSLYALSDLKKANDMAKNHLARLQGSDPRIIAQNKAIYAKQIRELASANGRTILQAAQAQIPYHPHMAPLAQRIAQVIPCLAEN